LSGKSLAVEPEIILADEPSSALDPISSRVIEEEFIKLKSDYTIILVTHILRQAKRVADNVIFMYYGEIMKVDRQKRYSKILIGNTKRVSACRPLKFVGVNGLNKTSRSCRGVAFFMSLKRFSN